MMLLLLLLLLLQGKLMLLLLLELLLHVVTLLLLLLHHLLLLQSLLLLLGSYSSSGRLSRCVLGSFGAVVGPLGAGGRRRSDGSLLRRGHHAATLIRLLHVQHRMMLLRHTWLPDWLLLWVVLLAVDASVGVAVLVAGLEPHMTHVAREAVDVVHRVERAHDMLVAEYRVVAVLAHAAHTLAAKHFDVVVAAQYHLIACETLFAKLRQRHLAYLTLEALHMPESVQTLQQVAIPNRQVAECAQTRPVVLLLLLLLLHMMMLLLLLLLLLLDHHLRMVLLLLLRVEVIADLIQWHSVLWRLRGRKRRLLL